MSLISLFRRCLESRKLQKQWAAIARNLQAEYPEVTFAYVLHSFETRGSDGETILTSGDQMLIYRCERDSFNVSGAPALFYTYIYEKTYNSYYPNRDDYVKARTRMLHSIECGTYTPDFKQGALSPVWRAAAAEQETSIKALPLLHEFMQKEQHKIRGERALKDQQFRDETDRRHKVSKMLDRIINCS